MPLEEWSDVDGDILLEGEPRLLAGETKLLVDEPKLELWSKILRMEKLAQYSDDEGSCHAFAWSHLDWFEKETRLNI
jgi:hypothetical protein